MISLLSSMLIRNHEQMSDPEVRRKYGVLCGAVGIFLNIILFGTKFGAGVLSASVAIMADAFNNLSDAGSSLITLIGFKIAGQAPDPNHPFGHGRIEYISGLIVSCLIILMGAELLKTSVWKIFHPAPVEGSALVAGILIAAIGVKLYMFFYNRSIGEKINSAAMKATAADSLSDMAATAAVLAATVIGWYTDWMIDGWCGLLVALFILYSGVMAAKDTISPLLGQPPDNALVERIKEIVLSYEGIYGLHDLIVHNYGPGRMMISLHAEVPAHGDIMEMHDTIDNIECQLQQELQCSAVIHMDPIITDDPKVNALRDEISTLVKVMDERITIHDFRMVSGPTHTNLIFDVVVPFQFRLTDEEVAETLKRAIHAMEEHQYIAVIHVDHPYVDVRK